ncbi:MAG: DUF3795 domain-containing protein [Bacteroidales bacterium]|nr:DUF3795 domain-containing protein [Bacteroidales bacterium]
MDYEQIKQRLAPCGLHCGKCYAFIEGDITENSKRLKDLLREVIQLSFMICIRKTFLWKNRETEYLLFSSMVAYNNMWGISFNLAPTEVQFNSFVEDVVLKSINNHPISSE